MLKPRYQLSSSTPPRATCASVVPKPFEKFSWKLWPPARFSIAKLTCVASGVVAEPRRRFGDEVDGRPDAQARADADDERAVVVDQLARQRVGVVDPDRLRRRRRRAGRASARRRRRSPASSCRGSCWCPRPWRARRSPTGMRVALPHHLLLREELIVLSLVRWTPICVPLMMPKRYSSPICAPPSRPKRVRQQIAEVALAERPREAVRHAERAREPRHPQRRRQRDQREVGLRRIDGAIARRLSARPAGWRWRRIGLLRRGDARRGRERASGSERRGSECRLDDTVM